MIADFCMTTNEWLEINVNVPCCGGPQSRADVNFVMFLLHKLLNLSIERYVVFV
jgi:hypothetical protein